MRIPLALALLLGTVSCSAAPASMPSASDALSPGPSSEAAAPTESPAASDTSTDAPQGSNLDDDSGDAPAAPDPDPEVEEIGTPPYPVGTTRFELSYGERTLPVQVWYPASASGPGQPSAHFEPPGTRRETLRMLFEEAPAACVRGTMDATQDAAPGPQSTPWPLVLFSHCHSCLRFSAFGVAEHLAAHGFVVAAPDHVGNTLFEELEGNPGPLDGEFLRTRREDIGAVLDALLEGTAAIPEGIDLDETRVGMFGHSYGAVTTGLVLQEDPRVRSGVAIAAPVENPLIPGVSVASLNRPLLYLVATEDNSITEIGNFTLRNNYDNHPTKAWKVEVEDAGHWSFSEICGLVDIFQAGCGQATRQTNPLAQVTYIDNVLARTIARDYVLAFFEHTLLQDAQAGIFLEDPAPMPGVRVDSHL